MNVPDWLLLLLFSIGMTVIAVLWVLRLQWQRVAQTLQQAQQLNERVDRDLLRFLSELSACLEPISVCGLAWQLQWFGQTIEQRVGCDSRYQHRIEMKEEEASLVLVLSVLESRFERAFYFDLIRRQIQSLCALDLALKMRQVSSFEQGVARYQMFLAHDLKNLAQMMILWQRQIQETRAEDAQRALLRWQGVAPLLADRAELLASRLSAPGEVGLTQSALTPIAASELVQRLMRWAQVHQVDLVLNSPIPNVCVLGDWGDLDDAAFQLMRNYQQHTDASEPVRLSISTPSGKQLLFDFCHAQPIDADLVKRMQEPLWTSSDLGLGLGLWQIGHVLQRIHGRFQVAQDKQGQVSFLWYLQAVQD